ncbi:MAG TPA: ATP-dependent Clp protease ATP-binding subunit [Candidatus Saccharimonadales bacterium]|nr:ATP-dependent Clp protease ATP-binding subunit [Candidatus Saccharimonadales bacterium]
MLLERLTQRVKDVLLSIPPASKITAGELLFAIEKSQGMGSFLLQTITDVDVEKTAKVSVKALIKEAYYQSLKFEHTYVGTEHLLLAVVKLTSSKDLDRIKNEILKLNLFPTAMKNVDKNKKTPLLDMFSENLNQKLFKEYNKPLLMRSEYNSLVSVLLQKNNNNILLVGDKGVGKSDLIQLLAKNINSLEVPPQLVGYQIYEFDLMAFMTNIFNKGGMDYGLGSLVDELKSLGRVILSIKNFQNLFVATNAGFAVPMFYSMFKSSLDSAGIKMVATLNPNLYEKIIGENEQIVENFSVIDVQELEEEQIIKILELNAEYLGQYHNISISADVVKHIYRKAKEELKDVKFPQKGLDLLDQACSKLLLKKSKIPESYRVLMDKTFLLAQNLDKNLENGDYANALKTRVKMQKLEENMITTEEKIFFQPKLKLTIAEVDEALSEFGTEKRLEKRVKSKENLNTLAERMKKKIIGQDTAVDTVAKALIRSKLGLRSKKRPLGNFLFLGPTGVGKTELAKVLAETAFGEDSLIRLDMSDFAEKHNVSRLVGAPPGYIGYGEGGELTQKIELHPDSVVLFDEIEKAHPDVLNILLQIMEEGELSDAKGNTFDFSRAVIILTSNLGTEILHNTEIGFDDKKLSDTSVEGRLKFNLKKILKAELLNRFDEVIVFKRLSSDDQLKILDLLIEEVADNLLDQNIALITANKAKQHLLKIGYSQEYGARSLRRTIEKDMLDKIAEILLVTKKRPLKLNVTSRDETIVVVSN